MFLLNPTDDDKQSIVQDMYNSVMISYPISSVQVMYLTRALSNSIKLHGEQHTSSKYLQRILEYGRYSKTEYIFPYHPEFDDFYKEYSSDLELINKWRDFHKSLKDGI